MKKTIYKISITILKPLVRIMIKHDISYSELSNILKHVYVDVAESDFTLENKKQTNSRISVLTGIHRKEVLRIKNEPLSELKEKKEKNASTRIISGWIIDPDYIDSNGEPLNIPKKGPKPSFAELVDQYGADTPPRAILDEMTRLGLVEVLQNEQIRLLSKVNIPYQNIEEKLMVASKAARDLLNTIDHNLEHNSAESRFQLSVAYDNIPDEAVNKFKNISSEHSIELLGMLNQWLAENDRDTATGVQGNGKNRIGLGIYYFEN